ncbi:MAG TPA: YfbU family protein [Caulobacteraceae bacterium]|jgi:hypothetical protein
MGALLFRHGRATRRAGPASAPSRRGAIRNFIRTLTFKPGERFIMHIDSPLHQRLDMGRPGEATAPSRPEATGRLLESGPAPKTQPCEPFLSNGEKLIAFMLCDVMGELGSGSARLGHFVETAIKGGHYWALDWELRDIFHDRRHTLDAVRFVLDVLDMWVLLEGSSEALSDDDMARLAEAAPHFPEVRCPGFDPNLEEASYGIAFLLARNVKRFGRFRDRLDFYKPHKPTADRYRSMLRAYEPIRETIDGRTLTVEEMITVLGAWRK